MEKIHGERISMRPRVYYVLGSTMVFVSVVLSLISSIFLVSLTNFALKTHGPMGQYRLEQLLSSFPWWAPILTIVGLVTGIRMMKRYDFSYKTNFPLLILGLVMAVLVAGWYVDYIQLDEVWFRQGPMKGIMHQYTQGSRGQQYRGWNMR